MSETLGKTNSFDAKISKLYNDFDVKIFKYNTILELNEIKNNNNNNDNNESILNDNRYIFGILLKSKNDNNKTYKKLYKIIDLKNIKKNIGFNSMDINGLTELIVYGLSNKNNKYNVKYKIIKNNINNNNNISDNKIGNTKVVIIIEYKTEFNLLKLILN